MAPIHHDAPDTHADHEEDATGLSLSGGGYRAMVFHLGTLWRLNELGVLRTIGRISSVSGGSIVSAYLGMKWSVLTFDGDGVALNFEREVADPIRAFAGVSIDLRSGLVGLVTPGSISDKIAKRYRKHLFGDATLQDFPDEADGHPRFVINATGLRSGVLWRFPRPYAANYRIGRIEQPAFTLAECVAASSAFPPFLSPATLEFPDGGVKRWPPKPWAKPEDLHHGDYLQRAILTDGGVYDNLGLEVIWKRHKHLLVSDAGGQMAAIEGARRLWPRQLLRVLGVVDNQVRSLRKRQLLDAYIAEQKDGAFWSIRGDTADYPVGDDYGYPASKTIRLANVKTRLKKMKPKLQEQLINWGYVACDTALRSWWNQGSWTKSDKLPYPDTPLD